MADIELTGAVNFEESVRKASRQIAEAFRDMELKVGADTTGAQTAIRALGRDVEAAGGEVRIDADTRGAASRIRELSAEIGRVFGNGGNEEAQNALKKQLDAYEVDKCALKKQLAEKKISLEEYNRRSRGLLEKEAEARRKAAKQASVDTEDFGRAVSAVFDGVGKSLSDDFIKSITSSGNALARETGRMETRAREMGGTLESVFSTIAEGSEYALGKAAAAFAGAIAAGADFGEAGKAFLSDLVGTAQKAVLVYSAEIFGAFASMGPWGIPLGIAAIATLQGMLSVAKGALGADQGVIGIDETYDRQATSRDIIPALLRKGESVLTPEFTSTHRELLSALYSGDSEEKYFFDNFVRPRVEQGTYCAAGSLPLTGFGTELHRLEKINTQLLKALEKGISVSSKSSIKITDRTTRGVKAKPMAFR